MLRNLVSVLACSALLAGEAWAADLLPAGNSLPPPPSLDVAMSPGFTWGGCHVGDQFGVTWTNNHFVATSGLNGSGYLSGSGVTFGAYGGCDQQLTDKVVVGAEGDFETSWVNATSNVVAVPGGTLAAKERFLGQGSLRLRAGYAVDNNLFYVTGGWALARVATTYLGTPAGLPGSTQTFASLRPGFTVGVGVERAINDNFIARLEYRYAAFASDTDTMVFAGALTPPGQTFRKSLTEHSIRMGVSYRFYTAPPTDAPITSAY